MEIFALYLWMKLPVITDIVGNMSLWVAWIAFLLVVACVVLWVIERVSMGDRLDPSGWDVKKPDDDSKASIRDAYKKKTSLIRRWGIALACVWFLAFSGTQFARMIPTQKETAALAAAYAAKVAIESPAGQALLDKLKAKIEKLAEE